MRKRNYTIDIVAIVIYIVRVFQKKRKFLLFMYTTSQIKFLLNNYGDRAVHTYYVIHKLSMYNWRDMNLLQRPSHIDFKREQKNVEIHYWVIDSSLTLRKCNRFVIS